MMSSVATMLSSAIRKLGLVLALLSAPWAIGSSAQGQGSTDPAGTATSVSQKCLALADADFSGLGDAPTKIVDARYHEATPELPANCDLRGYVAPTAKFGMMMPASNWNGKYVVRGCGGSCGDVEWTQAACSPHIKDGYTCIFTDMGHYSSQIDNIWAANNLQGQVDFGFRATHVVTIAGKAIAARYFGSAPKRSYFMGCSTGGRQAMVEAQRFPEDFDGIIALAPGGVSNFGRGSRIPADLNIGPDRRAILTDRQVPLIYKSAMAACDMKDGVKDGLIEARDCKFDPAVLQCKAGQTDPRSCLTPKQVAVAKGFYARGAQPGSELNWINNWTAEPGPAGRSGQRGDRSVYETLNGAGNPDLTAFRDHPAKLILVHGSSDLIITSPATTEYYETATRTMGGPEKTKDFFRYFIVNGMDHCSGGDGAWAVNYLPILERWVEQGKAPEKIVGIRPKPGVTLDYFGIDTDDLKPADIAFSRPYYPYPLKAYYAGGDPTAASSFKPGLAPTGKMSQGVGSAVKGGTPQAMAGEIREIARRTEATYAAAGLPLKNISDRVGKQLRFDLYNSGASDAAIKAALALIDPATVSDRFREALATLRPEYDLSAS